ncbi:hypothetical protein GUITHDRAFT_156432 [Guillardia theta CCMP2712]|uniref:CREG-like beta-barrel domain-containing protein n=1 Tax=Guillardia theta (strain CCMP2712) TaxID=905079 RepID=L1I6Z3_GUITC|nr:hypothetical protein GUITHDRAFT_156432 [Guillardia theta CCMP2712]EKX32021.1 hypothetical protein GUITHDRAFT_156432 [Guillardia theta CCMP2712]|eukprot:XP_005819001.1 hypothetical protein GUITHDRAFT_156432 [Guillardia theta CCMP2712]
MTRHVAKTQLPSHRATPAILRQRPRLNSLKMETNPKELRLELTLGELCKTLVGTCTSGTLCTTLPVREDFDGLHRFGPQSQATVEKWEKYGKEYPFGTLVSYLLNEEGQPYMLLANNAAHTRNIMANPKTALYVQNPQSPGQKGARVTLVGEIEKISNPQELKDCKEFYADRFPDQAEPLEDDRFSRYFTMYKLIIKDIYYVSGFGVTTCWVNPEEFSKAQADPLAPFSQELLDEWNRKRQSEYQALAAAFFGSELDLDDVDSPRITQLDRFGFDFRFRFPRKDGQHDGQYDIREYRIGFRNHAMSKEEAQSAMFKILQEAWEKINGYDDEWGDLDNPPMILKRATDLEVAQQSSKPMTVTGAQRD